MLVIVERVSTECYQRGIRDPEIASITISRAIRAQHEPTERSKLSFYISKVIVTHMSEILTSDWSSQSNGALIGWLGHVTRQLRC